MKKSAFLLPILAVIVALGLSSVFIVDEREKGLVLLFGRVVASRKSLDWPLKYR